MIIPNLVFDIALFGALLAAVIIDRVFPAGNGVATLIAASIATYVAAQELSDWFAGRAAAAEGIPADSEEAHTSRRGFMGVSFLPQHESLATALALSTAGFIYFWWRNDSDLMLLVLSIGLMMASLMVAISVIASFGAAVREAHPGPLGGLLLTTASALALGVMAGLWTLLASAGIKIIVLCLSFVVWKLREKMRPPEPNEVMGGATAASPHASYRGQDYVPISSRRESAEASQAAAQALAPANRVPWIPQRGTLLDRFLPVLVIGAVLFVVLKEARIQSILPSAPEASASSTNGGSESNPNPPVSPNGPESSAAPKTGPDRGSSSGTVEAAPAKTRSGRP